MVKDNNIHAMQNNSYSWLMYIKALHMLHHKSLHFAS